MKTILSTVLVVLLAGCTSMNRLQPYPYSIHAPCYSTILKAHNSGSDDKRAGMGLAVLGALDEAGFIGKPSDELVGELVDTCAANPELSFLQAAHMLHDKHAM